MVNGNKQKKRTFSEDAESVRQVIKTQAAESPLFKAAKLSETVFPAIGKATVEAGKGIIASQAKSQFGIETPKPIQQTTGLETPVTAVTTSTPETPEQPEGFTPPTATISEGGNFIELSDGRIFPNTPEGRNTAAALIGKGQAKETGGVELQALGVQTAQQRQQQILGQQLGQQLGQTDLGGGVLQAQTPDQIQALQAGLGNVLAKLPTSIVSGIGGALLGARGGPVGATALGVGAVGASLIGSFISGYQSNLNTQTSDIVSRSRTSLQDSEELMKRTIAATWGGMDKSQALAEFNRLLSEVDRQESQLLLNTRAGTNILVQQDGTIQLERYASFQRNVRPYLIQEMQAALASPIPNNQKALGWMGAMNADDLTADVKAGMNNNFLGF